MKLEKLLKQLQIMLVTARFPTCVYIVYFFPKVRGHLSVYLVMVGLPIIHERLDPYKYAYDYFIIIIATALCVSLKRVSKL